MVEKPFFKWKVVVIGDPAVGKTSLMLKYTEKKFKELYIPTVGVQVSVKKVPVKVEPRKEKRVVDLNIWDIAGHSKFHQIRKLFYAGANAFLLMYDLTSEKTLEACDFWNNDLHEVIGNQYGILIGNKSDLNKERVISEGEGEKKAIELGLDFIETSAKTGENINHVFEMLTQKLLTLYNE